MRTTDGRASQEGLQIARRGGMDIVEPRKLSYSYLEKITDNFSSDRIIGRGTFGVVYKGNVENGEDIAVKLLNPLQGIDNQIFDTEFSNLARLKHRNIVRLMGFCNDEEEVKLKYNGQDIVALRVRRALCLEFMEKGSLQGHLSDENKLLSWHVRYKIIKGICEGLKYLHTGLERPVYHLDLKPDNILLDKNMEPKIADFGLSMLLGEQNTKNIVRTVGTRGYLPPEYITNQLISKEFDIFSLGVIIMKIVTRTGYYDIGNKKPAEVIKHVEDEWRESLQAIQLTQVTTCVEIALKCTEEKKRRPSIRDIIDQLSETERHPSDQSSENVLGSNNNEAGNSPEETSIDASIDKRSDKTPSLLSAIPKAFSLNELMESTSNFSPENFLSESAFGKFYKGCLNGKIIAVKKLAENSPIPPSDQFICEVAKLIALSHENILKLLGFCRDAQKNVVLHNGKYIIVDIEECILCYEYASKGRLDKYISDKGVGWVTRFKIIKGICNGLHFLHTQIDNPIIHMDIHPASILLDDNMVAKIADFGLSRLLGEEQTRMNTINVIGSIGYMAPEYLYRGEISPRCDIYSLGLLIMEITTREKNNSLKEDNSGRTFINNIRERWTDEHIAAQYSSSLGPDELQQVKICIEVALECVDVDGKNRPSIVEIVDRLNI